MGGSNGLEIKTVDSGRDEVTGEERRRTPRHLRRIPVSFRAQGGETSTSGMTANLSLSGVFIAAPKVYPRGTRLRLELKRDGGPVVIEGVVAHSHRVPVELRALGTSGMGVRFLPPEDLVAPLLPDVGSEVEAEEAEEPPRSSGTPRVFRVTFTDASEFLECHRRDLVNGGIFVRADRPRRPHSLIELELEVPGQKEPVPVHGRVVQVIEPQDGDVPAQGGMGVELLDLEDLLGRLRPVVDRLGG